MKKRMRDFLFWTGLSIPLFFLGCSDINTDINKKGNLEGKVVVLPSENLSLTPPLVSSLTSPLASQCASNNNGDVKICLIEKGKGKSFDEPCDAETYVKNYETYNISANEGDYHECFDANDDLFYDECDSTEIVANTTTYSGKKEIECKKKKKYNCFIGLDKVNYCHGDIMNISISCNGDYPNSLIVKFVNEKDKSVYDTLQISPNNDYAYPIPHTWPATNSALGADWKVYLYAINKKNYEDKDNFNILDKCSHSDFEVILENGAEYTNNPDLTRMDIIPLQPPDELAYCTGLQQCQPENWENFKQSIVVTLPKQNGKAYGCAKIKKENLESKTKCDGIIVDTEPPQITINKLEQGNYSGGNTQNEVLVEMCINDNFSLEKVALELYNANNEKISFGELTFWPDSNCVLNGGNGGVGFASRSYLNNLGDETYTLLVRAKDKARNEGKKLSQFKIDLKPPDISLDVLDHLLKNYVCYENQGLDEEACSQVNGSEYRFDASYPEFYTNQVGLDGRSYDGILDINVNASDISGVEEVIVDWDDGSISNIKNNNFTNPLTHTYVKDGYYTIKAKAKDIYNNESPEISKKIKIVIHRRDAIKLFWNDVYPNVSGLLEKGFYADEENCQEAENVNGSCIVTDISYRILTLSDARYGVDVGNLGYDNINFGHVFVGLSNLVSNSTPIHDLRLSNNEIIFGKNDAKGCGLTWAWPLILKTYNEAVNDLLAQYSRCNGKDY